MYPLESRGVNYANTPPLSDAHHNVASFTHEIKSNHQNLPSKIIRKTKQEFKLIWRDFILNKVCSTVLLPNFIRRFLYRMNGIDLERNVNICAHCFMGSNKLKIGRGTFVNYNVWFNTAGGIRIGSQCNIACNVMFLTSTHEFGDEGRRAGTDISKAITIGDGTWIGARAIILPGVTIGKAVIIGAGAVVTKDCESNCLYAGNPARKIKELRSDRRQII